MLYWSRLRRLARRWRCCGRLVAQQPLKLADLVLFDLLRQDVEQLVVDGTGLRLRLFVPEVELSHILLLERRSVLPLARGAGLPPRSEVQVQLIISSDLGLRESWRIFQPLKAAWPPETTEGRHEGVDGVLSDRMDLSRP